MRGSTGFGVAAFLLPLAAVGLLVAGSPVAALAVFAGGCGCRWAQHRLDRSLPSHAIDKGAVREVRRWLHDDVLETEADGDITLEFYRRPWLGGVVVTRVYYNNSEEP